MLGPWADGPQPVGAPCLGWGAVSGEAHRTHTAVSRGKARSTPESLGLPSRAALPWLGWGLTEGDERAPLIPSFARASSLGLFIFMKVLGGLLREEEPHESTGRFPGEQATRLPPGAHLDGCTGTGTGPGRLWYMRMMLRISLLGSARWGAGFELGTAALPWDGLPPPPGPASQDGSASASFGAALAPPGVGGFLTTGGGGGDGTDQEDRKRETLCRNAGPGLPHRPTTCSRFLPMLPLLLLLGDLHFGWRLHHLHLDLLLPCKSPRWPCYPPPGLPTGAPGQATLTQGSTVDLPHHPLAKPGGGQVCSRACHPKHPHPSSGNSPVSPGSSWAARAWLQPPVRSPVGRKGK